MTTRKSLGIFIGSAVFAVLLIIALIVILALHATGTVPLPSVPSPAPTTQSSLGPWAKDACQRKQCPKGWKKRPLIVWSLDGFWAGYLARGKTRALQRLIDCGVHIPFMFPSYPSKTFPNHYTIATGLYPESHGIIDNGMYDKTITPAADRWFSLGKPSSLNPGWWGGEPIWNTVRRAGLKSATYFWPGSDVAIEGMRPNYYQLYDGDVPFRTRVDGVINWLKMNDSARPDFLMLYIEQPDHYGHIYGPKSQQVTDELTIVDQVIDYMMTSLFNNGFTHCVDIVILADHANKGQTYVANYVDTTGMAVFSGPVGRVMLGNSTLNSTFVRDSINGAAQSAAWKPFRVYERHSNVPARLHYERNDRIGDVILDSDPGYMVFKDEKSAYTLKGNHGYDFRFNSMHALFLAHGPSFKQNFTGVPFENIELYNLFTMLVGAGRVARTNNGTQGTLYEILRNHPLYPAPSREGSTPCAADARSLSTCGCGTSASANFAPWTGAGAWKLSTSTVSNPLSTCDGAVQPFYFKWAVKTQMPIVVETTLTGNSTVLNTTDRCVLMESKFQDQCGFLNISLTIMAAQNIGIYPLIGFSDPTYQRLDFHNALMLRAPMYDSFFNGVWKDLRSLVAGYARTHGPLHLLSGPIFDYNSDGLADSQALIANRTDSRTRTPIPTAFFMILVRQPPTWPDSALSFVLPHRPLPINVQSGRDYAKMHTARVRDVELLTGLELFASMGDRQQATRLRTHINLNLWQ